MRFTYNAQEHWLLNRKVSVACNNLLGEWCLQDSVLSFDLQFVNL